MRPALKATFLSMAVKKILPDRKSKQQLGIFCAYRYAEAWAALGNGGHGRDTRQGEIVGKAVPSFVSCGLLMMASNHGHEMS